MKRNCIILLMSMIVVSLFSAIPQNNSKGQSYINSAKAALDRKDYDESMRWAQRYIDEYHSYTPLASIAEQMYQDAKKIYPNDKKGFVKPLEYAGCLGHSDALYLLGMQYYAGQFIPKDMEKGMALLKASEKLGNSKAANAYKTFSNDADWIAHNAKLRRYNDMIVGAVGLTALIAVAAKIIGNLGPSSSSSKADFCSKKYSSQEVARLLASGNLYACRFKDGSNMTKIDFVTRVRIIQRSGTKYMTFPDYIRGEYKIMQNYSHTLKGGVVYINEGGDNFYLMDSDKNLILY